MSKTGNYIQTSNKTGKYIFDVKQIREIVMIDVLIMMGSASDKDKMKPCQRVLADLGVRAEVVVSSAHRTPRRTEDLVAKAEKDGVKVFICAAGMAAHLAGAVAARTIKPVIGVPISGSALVGLDALLSTVQMPPGFPVATTALDSAGARNAAWLAAQILALTDPALAERMEKAREKMRKDVEKSSLEVQEEFAASIE